MNPRRGPRPFEERIILTSLAAILPLLICALLLAWLGDFDTKTRWTVVALGIVSLLLGTYVLHERLTFPLRTLSNVIAALREEDYSLRGRSTHADDVLGEAFEELNRLASMMEDRKLEAVEAAALLRAVLYEIDTAIFAFDAQNKLRLVNRAAERLLDSTSEWMIGRSAEELALDRVLSQQGRWNVRRSTFRERGEPHTLLVVTDISRALREEEVQAWQKLVRVISHEMNNSLAPIKSIATSVERLVSNDPLPADWREDVVRGTNVISSRADALTRFMRAYAQLAKLPQPRKQTVSLGDLVRRVASLERRLPVAVNGSPPLLIEADPDQLEQMLINIVKNAVDASLETGGGVAVSWRPRQKSVELQVIDDGAGLSGSANLFVPFFTTKPEGSGIGLVLSRQIAEGHGGTLTLENRTDARGCVATVTLPVEGLGAPGSGP